MNQVSLYDWSSLNRDSMVSIISTAGKDIVGFKLDPITFTKILRTKLREYNIPVKIKTVFESPLSDENIWVGGLYDSDLDNHGKRAITLLFNYTDRYEKIKLSYYQFRKLCYNITDIIFHEIIHLRQYRRRNFKDIPGYASTAELFRKRQVQEYLGDPDEIDAYAFNIACELYDIYKQDYRSILNYLNSDLTDGRKKQTLYRMYLYTFDHNHNNSVIKKLKKKITHYLPYAALGKPYKTSDWLKV